ncbi:MAG: hypothetical protein GTN78_09135 [Gemmatimonadales bacterium]|nr:hypothetical protein [Gemmatimonadales bacterium]NIN10576.1 hypothetical protein [Gemmatimonadales bacterium]NIR00348.1 hypothetical protein [Gemmatimonadales bacterium]NIS64664.1 hypothetical protein [Gemmatimonadales bacterium]
MPVPAIAIHESGRSVDIARAMNANFADSSHYDRVVTLGFDWNRTVPRLDHRGLRNLYRYLKRNAANIGAASRTGLEFGIHTLDAAVGALQLRLHRLLQSMVSGILALLVVRWVAGFVVLRPAAWYGLPTVAFTPMQWLAAAAGWLEVGIAAGVTVLVVLSGLRLLLTLSPRPPIVTLRSIVLLFLQPVMIVTIAVLAVDSVLLWTFFGVLGLLAFLVSSTGALVPWGVTLGAFLALRSSWGRRSIGEPIKAMLGVFRYLGEPGYRRGIQQALDKAIVQSRKRVGEDREFVLAGQGMGAVIALDSMLHSREWRDTDRVLLVTMASPLRRYFLRLYPRTLFPEFMEDLIGSIVGRLDEFRWINVRRPGDYMGADLGLKPFEGRDLTTGWTGRRTFGHADYWRSLDARHTLHLGLDGLQPIRPVRAAIKDPKHCIPNPRKSVAGFSIPPLARTLFWTTLLLATFGWTLRWVATGSGILVSTIDETPELLVRHGVVVEAAVTHRRETVETDRGLTYVDHWEFDFNGPTGTAKRLHVQHDVSEAFLGMVPLRFDDREFTRQIRAECAVGDQPPSWWPRRDMKTPCTMKEVRLRYYPGDEALFDLPDFPPRRALRDPVRGWTEAGVVAAVLSLLLLVSVVLGVRLFVLILG